MAKNSEIEEITDEATDLVEQDVTDIDVDHDDEGEHHTSLAARTLQILLVLFIGAAIGIWAAPKIAPKLPKGLAPLAQWLSPSDSASMDEVAALRLDVVSRLIDLESRPGSVEFEARLSGFQTDIIGPLRAQMSSLSAQVAASDSTAIESRLWAVESKVEGLVAELTGLTESIGSVATEGGSISADMAASIAAYRTRIDAMQVEIDNLNNHVGGISRTQGILQGQIEGQLQDAKEAVIMAEQEAFSVETQSEIGAALAGIKAGLDSGEPFIDALDIIARNSDVSLGEALPIAAPLGGITLDHLRETFVGAAHEAIRESISADGGDGISTIGAFIRSQVATRSLTPQSGDSTDAILSRIEGALKHDDIDGAASEIDGLSEVAKTAMAGWLLDFDSHWQEQQQFKDLVQALGVGEE